MGLYFCLLSLGVDNIVVFGFSLDVLSFLIVVYSCFCCCRSYILVTRSFLKIQLRGTFFNICLEDTVLVYYIGWYTVLSATLGVMYARCFIVCTLKACGYCFYNC